MEIIHSIHRREEQKYIFVQCSIYINIQQIYKSILIDLHIQYLNIFEYVYINGHTLEIELVSVKGPKIPK